MVSPDRGTTAVYTGSPRRSRPVMLPSRVTPSAPAATDARANVSWLGTTRSDSAGECFATLCMYMERRVGLLGARFARGVTSAVHATSEVLAIRLSEFDEFAEFLLGDADIKGLHGFFTVRQVGAENFNISVTQKELRKFIELRQPDC